MRRGLVNARPSVTSYRIYPSILQGFGVLKTSTMMTAEQKQHIVLRRHGWWDRIKAGFFLAATHTQGRLMIDAETKLS